MRAPRLDMAPAKPANALIRGAKVLDPRTGIDGNHDLLISDRTDLGRPTIRYDELEGEAGGDTAPPASRPVLILTTGTTGAPRGVRHDWDRLLARAADATPAPDQRWLLAYEDSNVDIGEEIIVGRAGLA